MSEKARRPATTAATARRLHSTTERRARTLGSSARGAKSTQPPKTTRTLPAKTKPKTTARSTTSSKTVKPTVPVRVKRPIRPVVQPKPIPQRRRMSSEDSELSATKEDVSADGAPVLTVSLSSTDIKPAAHGSPSHGMRKPPMSPTHDDLMISIEKSKLQGLYDTVAAARAKQTESDGAISSAIAREKEIREQFDQLENTLKKTVSQRDKLWNGLSQAIEQRDALQAKLQDQTAIKTLQVKHEEEMEAMHTKEAVHIAGHRRELAELQSKLDAESEHVAERSKQLATLLRERETLRRDNDALKQALRQKMADSAQWEDQKTQLQSENSEIAGKYERQMSELLKEIDHYKSLSELRHMAISETEKGKYDALLSSLRDIVVQCGGDGDGDGEALLSSLQQQLSHDGIAENERKLYDARISQLGMVLDQSLDRAGAEYAAVLADKRKLERTVVGLREETSAMRAEVVRVETRCKQKFLTLENEMQADLEGILAEKERQSHDLEHSRAFIKESVNWMQRMSSELAVFVAQSSTERERAVELEALLQVEKEMRERAKNVV